MNGKIKTKFAALFAVALMITVCVVPMVGGSEDVEAATTTQTVTISGSILGANSAKITDGTDIKVYYGEGKFDFVDVSVDNTNGTQYTITVPAGKDYTLTVDASANEKYKDYAFPEFEIKNITANKTFNFVAGTVVIDGGLFYYDADDVSEAEFTVSDIEVSVKNGNKTQKVMTDASGEFKFLAVPGETYKVSASFAGVNFSSENYIAKNTGNDPIVVEAEGYFFKAEISAPFGTFSTSAAAGTDSEKGDVPVATITDDEAEIVTISSEYYIFAPIKFNTVEDDEEPVGVNGKMNYGYGIEKFDDEIVDAEDEGNVTGDMTVEDVLTGSITVGTIGVDAEVEVISKDDGVDESISAKVIDGTYYAGLIYEYKKTADGSDKSLTKYTVKAELEGYIFEYDTDYGNFTANNAATVTITSDVAKTEFDVDAENAVVGDDGFVTGALGSDVSTLVFYVPLGTKVSVEAPANYAPSSEVISAVNANVSLAFTYAADVIYTGQVLLNGIPVSLTATDVEFSLDGGKEYSSTGVVWVANVDEPYYTIPVPRTTDASDVMVKLKLNDEKASGYLFEENNDDEGYTAAVGVTGTTIGAFNVKAEEQSITLCDGNDSNTESIPGMEVSFYMLKPGDSGALTTFDEDSIVAELGKAISNENGVATIKAASPLDNSYTIWAVPSDSGEFGEYSFINEGYLAEATAYAEQYTYSGYYTANGSSLPGFGMSYVAVNNDGKIQYFGDATIIDNKYYIVGKPEYTLNLTLKDGFSFEVNAENKTCSITGSEDLVAYAFTNVEKFDVKNMISSEYSNFAKISVSGDNVAKGTVIVLSAQEACYKVQNEMYGYKYADSAIEYKFAGWYVNGKLLTEDCDASITLSEDVVIVAQYEEAIKVIASEEAPEAGLDTNVLILGIVVVVIALIAVVYSVISKRD